VIARHPQRLRASVLAAGRKVDALALCRPPPPDHAVIADEALYPACATACARPAWPPRPMPAWPHRPAGRQRPATPWWRHRRRRRTVLDLGRRCAGKRLLLANKESLVLAGELLTRRRTAGAEIIPIDSEHSAIFQCLRSRTPARRAPDPADRFGRPVPRPQRAELAVTPAQAVAHPKWSMGRRSRSIRRR
jgi:1-deoxy-D-xylulose-5-phosphate reductoisomerase